MSKTVHFRSDFLFFGQAIIKSWTTFVPSLWLWLGFLALWNFPSNFFKCPFIYLPTTSEHIITVENSDFETHKVFLKSFLMHNNFLSLTKGNRINLHFWCIRKFIYADFYIVLKIDLVFDYFFIESHCFLLVSKN